MTNLSCSYGLQLFLRLCAMSADLKGAVLRKLGDEPRWAGLRFRRELPLWLTEISAVPAYNPIMAAISSRRAGKSVAAAPSSSSIQGIILLSLIGLSPVVDLGNVPGLQVLY